MACADGRVALGQCDPIQVPGPRKPSLSCVGVSGSLYEDDLDGECHGWEAGQMPLMTPNLRETIFFRLASDEFPRQRGQSLNILDTTGLFAMVLTARLALHDMKDNHHG